MFLNNFLIISISLYWLFVLFLSITDVKLLSQQLVDKWLLVVKTEQWHSMITDKESLKQETLDNVKSEYGGHISVVNSITKTDSGVSSEYTNNNTSDLKFKTEKTKSKNENDKVLKKTLDQTKKEKNSLNIKVKDDLDDSKDKPKIKKDKINDESDDSQEKKRRVKDKNCNPFLRIIGEMTDEKSDEDKQIENENSTKNLSRRKQNLKNLSSGEKMMKIKLLNESKKCGRNLNSTSDTKKETRPLPAPAPKLKLPESKTILEKKNYSINIEKKEIVGEKKPTVKTFKSKFRSTGLEEQPPPPPSKSKVQSKKSVKNLTSLSLSKAEKRSLSPPSSDSPIEKKPKNSPTDTKKPRKNLIVYIIINFFNHNKFIAVPVLKYNLLTLKIF